MTKAYQNLLHEILEYGENKADRTGVGTVSLFSPSDIKFDLREGFPLLTTKQVSFRLIKEELLWFISGSDNLKPLLEKDVHIWDGNGLSYWLRHFEENLNKYPEMHDDFKTRFRSEINPTDFLGDINERLKDPVFASKYENLKEIYFDMVSKGEYEAGCLGHIYGVAWRNYGFKNTDQVKNVIESLKNNPDSRRHIINAWHPNFSITKAALPPCHVFVQFYVSESKYLHCKMTQRSADVFLGVPFNIASYALFTELMAKETGYEAGTLTISFGDAHIYTNHLEPVQKLLAREPLVLPTLSITDEHKSIFKMTGDDIQLLNYQSHGVIKAPMAI